MLKTKLYILYIQMLFCALGIVLIVGFVLAQSSHEKDAITVRLISMNELRTNLERSISFNKSYSESTNFHRRIQNLVMPIVNEIGLRSIAFIGNEENHRVLYAYSSDPQLKLAQSLPKIFARTHDPYDIIDFQDLKWIKVNLYQEDRSGYEEKKYVGAFIMGFPKEVFTLSLSQFMLLHYKVFIAIFLVGSIVLGLMMFKSQLKFLSPNGHKIINKRYLTSLIVLCQLGFSIVIMQNLYAFYVDDAKNVVRDTVLVQAKSMNRIFDLGLPLSTYDNSEDFFKSKFDLNNSLYSFKIIDKNNKSVVDIILGEDALDAQPINVELKSKKQSMGYIEAKLDGTAINNEAKLSIIYLLLAIIITLLLNLGVMRLYQNSHYKA